jgi:putative hydrolase of the HAD superfamily
MDILQELKERRAVALVSNFDYSPYVFRLLEQLGLKHLFDAIVVSDAVGLRKPDPAIFHHALQRTGLSPANIIHVGDSPEDVHGAQAAGIRPVWICRDRQTESNGRKHPGVHRISALNQLRQLLD